MVISISGTHCTGKTTLINELKKDPFFKDAIFLSSSGKGLSKFGLNINTEGDSLTQLYLACRDFQQLVENRNNPLVILDRSIVDTFIYTRYLYYQKKIVKDTYDMTSYLLKVIIEFIDHIFLLKPTFDLVEEKERSMDKQFQMDIFDLFDSVQKKEDEGEITYLPDDLEGRINTIKEFLKTK